MRHLPPGGNIENQVEQTQHLIGAFLFVYFSSGPCRQLRKQERECLISRSFPGACIGLLEVNILLTYIGFHR